MDKPEIRTKGKCLDCKHADIDPFEHPCNKCGLMYIYYEKGQTQST